MATQNQGWAFVSASAAAGTTAPGGSDTNIQFNNNGSFSGSALLTTDGSGSLSASVNISASAFYGDGTNLTGLTASAVNVADGPEFALQWRYDTPVSGEISGSSALTYLTSSKTLKLDGASLSSSANISASAFYGDGSNLTGIVPDISGTPANNEIAVWTDADTLEGEGKLTFDGSVLTVTAGVSASVNVSASAFYGDFYGNSLINNSGHLTIQNEVANKKIINKLGSADSNTSFQIRASDDTAHFAVDGAGTVIVTPTGILQISSAGVLSSSANLSASSFYGDGSNLTGLSAGSPGGSDKQIQYNNNSSFAGSAYHTFTTASGGTSGVVELTGSMVVIAPGALTASMVNVVEQLRFGRLPTIQTASFNVRTDSFSPVYRINTSSSAVTVGLPSISGNSDYTGLQLIFKDVGGSGSTNSFILSCSAPDTIDGAIALSMSADYGSIGLIADPDEAQWWIIFDRS